MFYIYKNLAYLLPLSLFTLSSVWANEVETKYGQKTQISQDYLILKAGIFINNSH